MESTKIAVGRLMLLGSEIQALLGQVKSNCGIRQTMIEGLKSLLCEEAELVYFVASDLRERDKTKIAA